MQQNTPISELNVTHDVETVAPGTSLSEVIKKMQKHKVGSIIIVDQNKPVGIFTERDLLMKIGSQQLDTLIVDDFMTPSPKTVLISGSIGQVVLRMRMGRFRHVVVVDDNGDLAGVISVKDVLDYLYDSTLGARDEPL